MILYCMVCREEVPEDRVKKKAKTCSKECGRALRLWYFEIRRMRAEAIKLKTIKKHTVPAQLQGSI